MQTILYARVSTAEQTLAHQRTQAEAAGYKLDHVLADHGVSGLSTRLADRPEGKRLFDLLRAGDILVVRWVDRLAEITATCLIPCVSSCTGGWSSALSSTR